MKLKFRKPKSQLDEMQEQKLNKAGNTGMRIAFFGLFFAIMIQLILDADLSKVMGEYVVFTILCAYNLLSNFKRGFWSRYFKPGIKNYLACSLLSGAIVGLFVYIICLRLGPIYSVPVDTVLWFFGSFLGTFILFLILGSCFKHRIWKLEEDEDE